MMYNPTREEPENSTGYQNQLWRHEFERVAAEGLSLLASDMTPKFKVALLRSGSNC